MHDLWLPGASVETQTTRTPLSSAASISGVNRLRISRGHDYTLHGRIKDFAKCRALTLPQFGNGTQHELDTAIGVSRRLIVNSLPHFVVEIPDLLRNADSDANAAPSRERARSQVGPVSDFLRDIQHPLPRLVIDARTTMQARSTVPIDTPANSAICGIPLRLSFIAAQTLGNI